MTAQKDLNDAVDRWALYMTLAAFVVWWIS